MAFWNFWNGSSVQSFSGSWFDLLIHRHSRDYLLNVRKHCSRICNLFTILLLYDPSKWCVAKWYIIHNIKKMVRHQIVNKISRCNMMMKCTIIKIRNPDFEKKKSLKLSSVAHGQNSLLFVWTPCNRLSGKDLNKTKLNRG